MELAALKQAAEAATAGPWKLRTHPKLPSFVQANGPAEMPYQLEVLGDDYTGFGDVMQRNADAAFVALANPQAVLELIASHERLEAALQKIASAYQGEEGCYYTNRTNIQVAKAALAATGAA